MNKFKKSFAIILCLLLNLTCLAGCHKKGEIAVKVGDYEFSSGYYSCALFYADTEARSLVEEQLESDDDTSTDSSDIGYWNYKVEDTDYVEWVENKALSNIKEIAALKTLCAKGDVTLDEETVESAKSTAETLWNDYGYSTVMEANGIAKTTFVTYMQDSFLADEYFEFVYGEGGEKEISADKLNEQLNANYVLVNKLEASFTDKTEEEIEDLKNQFTSYETKLTNKTEDFESIYLNYNNISAEEHTHEEAEEGELEPLDHHATILGGEDTSYTSDYYDTAKDMAVGEIKLITLDDDAGLVLLVKQDITADPYYVDYLDVTLRNEIAGDEFKDYLADYGDELECTVNKSSTKQFSVKKIKYS